MLDSKFLRQDIEQTAARLAARGYELDEYHLKRDGVYFYGLAGPSASNAKRLKN